MKSRVANKSEGFVLDVCQKSFLSLWCTSSPRGKEPGDELCDILVVCDPHVIIISVKAVQLQSHKEPALAWERWERKAIDRSVEQIYGAQRWLAKASRVIRHDGSPGLVLPPSATRRVHRIAVAGGGQGEVPIKSGDFGKGYVHVLSESGFWDILSELDTIIDLVAYLAAKEAYKAAGSTWLVLGGENNLLAYYLLNNKTFPKNVDLLHIDDTLWGGLSERADYQRKKTADEVSYYWDKLIETYTGPNAELIDSPGPDFERFEFALRTMAREDRFSRRILGKALTEFLDAALIGSLRSRTSWSQSGVVYVWVFFSPNVEGDVRRSVLADRCELARHTVGSGNTVIGIGFVESEPRIASVRELACFDASDWSSVDDERIARLKAERNFDSRFAMRKVDIDEYQQSD